ncbi:MAG: LLM class flavin-dependent oxidoreductase [Actinomycetota bacterium]
MRLGLALPHYDSSLAGEAATWDGLRTIAQTAEQAGFDSLWVSDHLFLDWGKYGGKPSIRGSFECWTTMTAVAAVTRTARIGSLVLCNDFRNPGLLAKMAASLDLLSGGRLDLGMGAGWYEPEYQAAGIEFSAPGKRIARLEEAAGIVGRLLAGEEVTYDGRFYSMRGAVCRPGPVQQPRPPIWIGGKGDRLLQTVARVADGWNFSWLGSFDDYAARAEAADKTCDKAGRDPATLRRSVGVYLLAGRDDKDVAARWSRLAQRTPEGILAGSSDGTAVSWQQFRQRSVAGTVSEVTDRLRRLSEFGVEEVIVSLGALPFQVADVEDVELVGTEIAPALR